MPRNQYIGQNVQSEKNLYEDLIIESIKINGHDMFYMPREMVSIDKLLVEDTESKFKSAFDIEMYIENVDGYEGDGVLLSKFGLEIRNQIRLIVAKRRWNSLIGKWSRGYNNYRPSEGDLIYVPQVKGLFEVKYVDLETPFHQLNNLPVYRMTCELFEYCGEDIDTGIPEVDSLQALNSLDASYQVAIEYSDLSQVFNLHDELNMTYPSGKTGTCRVTSIRNDESTQEIIISISALRFTDSEIHELTTGITLVNPIGYVANVLRVLDLEEPDIDSLTFRDTSIQNPVLEQEANEFLDFTELNPFGEPSDSKKL